MKALVAYYSETGNTQKVAEAIFEATPIDKELKKVQEVKSADGFDIIFYGFPVTAHSVPEKAALFISRLPSGQKIAFFSTHGSLNGGLLPKQAMEHALGLAAKLKVLGHFGCRGQVSQQIIDALLQSPEHKAWAEEARGAIGHPDKNDLADAKTFAAEMLAKINK
jgi:flavodoxin